MIFIVGITKTKHGNAYRLLRVRKDSEGKQAYEAAILSEAVLKSKMAQGLKVENARLSGTELVGTTGSLDRFTAKEGHSPFVIISELVDRYDNTLGYRVADYSGKIRAVRLADLIQHAQKAKARGLIAIQNGMYVEKSGDVKPHIRSYRASGYPKEVFGVDKPTNTYKAQNDSKANKKNTVKIEEIFTPAQIKQLKLGKEAGVNIALYANREFSAEQMRQIREGLQAGIKAKLYADPKFSLGQMIRLKAEMMVGIDVTPYANPAYTIAQMTQIKLGMLSGVDYTLYANPKTTAEEMSEIRMRLEAGIWCDCEASKISADSL